jgi:hypothetical protein
METKLFFKISLLLLSLVGIILLMYYLKHNSPIEAILPPEPTRTAKIEIVKATAIEPGQEKILWCKTRVKSLRLDSGEVVQEGRQWKVRGTKEEVLDFIVFEKWLAEHCLIVGNHADDTGGFEKLLGVTFIDGKSAWFEKGPEGQWKWQGQVFRSAELENAITELRDFMK